MYPNTLFSTSRSTVLRTVCSMIAFYGCITFLIAQQTVTINQGVNLVFLCQNSQVEITSSINDGEGCLNPDYQWQINTSNSWEDLSDFGDPFYDTNTEQLLIAASPTIGDYDKDSIRLRIICNPQGMPDTIYSNIISASSLPPIPMASPSGTVCPGTEVTFNVNNDGLGGTFSWYKNNTSLSNQIGSGVSASDTPTLTTTYFVRREIDGCFSVSRGIQIMVDNIPVSEITAVDLNIMQPCEGQQVILTASGGTGDPTTIKWYSAPNGGGQLLFTGRIYSVSASNTTYYVRRENGCGDETEDFVFVLEAQDTPMAAFLDTPQSLCKGVPFTFQANTSGNADNVVYTWAFPGGSASTTSGAGPIEVTYNNTNTNANVTLFARQENNSDCQSTAVHSFPVIDKPSLSINDEFITPSSLPFEVAANTNANLILTSNLNDVTFDWSFTLINGRINGTPGTGQGSLINGKWVLPDGEESAELEGTITVSNGNCTATYVIKVLIQPLLFVPNVLTVNGDGENECWTINVLEDSGFTEQDFNIELYSQTGKCVRGCSEVFTVKDAIEWCGEGCGAGAYFYRITGPEGYEKLGSLTLVK